MFQVGNCVYCTKAVRCNTASVRELRDKIRGKEVDFFVFRYIIKSHGVSGGGSSQKEKKGKKMLPNTGCIQNTCVALKNSDILSH